MTKIYKLKATVAYNSDAFSIEQYIESPSRVRAKAKADTTLGAFRIVEDWSLRLDLLRTLGLWLRNK